jgi:inosine-uridine nucleoside N-ribohydrolase
MENATRTRRGFLKAAGMAGIAGLAGARAASQGPGVRAAGPRQKIILDVDTGTDDAVALMFGALHPALELVAATTVRGNVELEFTTENTLRVFDHIGVPVPVYRGMASPIVRSDFPSPRSGGSPFHGQYLDLPASRSRVRDTDAVDFLIETYSRESGREIILVPVGPLSNVAMALKRAPRIADNLREIVLMGGAHEMGNVTASAEFNVWADPEAAQVVFRSGVAKLTMVPLDATHKAQVSLDDAAKLRALGTPAGTAAATFVERRVKGYMEFDHQARPAAPVHDALAVASIVNPAVITTVPAYVDVETQGALTVGRTVVDRRGRMTAQPNARVALSADEPLFVRMLMETLGRTAAAAGA